MKKLLGSVLVVMTMANVSAQNNEDGIEEVIVQGKFLNLPYKKVNENIEIITRKEIQNSPAKSLDEILQQFSGMDIRRRGANGVQADISVRGSSFEQVMILVNGIRMNDSQTGHNSMNIPVDLQNVERIEIIKGPAARRFGQNAYAGVINIITKTNVPNHVKISAEGGDFETYNLGVSSNFGNEKFSNLIQANSGASEGYRHNSDYKINNIFYQNNYQIQNGKIGFQAGFSEKKFGANGFYASPLATEQYEETQASIVSVNHQQNFGKLGLNSNVYWRRGQDLYLYNRAKPEIYRNMHIGNNVGGEINGSYQSFLGTTGLGLELRKEFLQSNNLGERERFLSQVFFEHHFHLIQNKLQISPGISWANYSDNGNFFYPGLDVGFEFNNSHKIYGNVAKVHRIPTFTDLYYVSGTEQGNPNLQPENAVPSEIGYRFQNSKIVGKLSGFLRNSKNSIDWTKENPNAIWMAENIGSLVTKGIEAEFRQNVAKWLNYSVSYTFIENENRVKNNLLSRYSLDHLKHQFIAKLQTKFLKYFTNEVVFRHNERMNLGSYNVLDEKLSFQKNNLSIYLLINNLTNSIYTETFGVEMPKRWFHLGLSYDIKFQ